MNRVIKNIMKNMPTLANLGETNCLKNTVYQNWRKIQQIWRALCQLKKANLLSQTSPKKKCYIPTISLVYFISQDNKNTPNQVQTLLKSKGKKNSTELILRNQHILILSLDKIIKTAPSQLPRWCCQCSRCRRRRSDSWVRKIPWRRAWQPTPVFLPGEFHGQRSLVVYSPQVHRAGHDWSNLAYVHTEVDSQGVLGNFSE